MAERSKITDFSSEYKHFIEKYVLSLMGIPKSITLKICHDNSSFPVVDASVHYDSEKKTLYFLADKSYYFYLEYKRGVSQDSIRLARCICSAFFAISEFNYNPNSRRQKKTTFYSPSHRNSVYQAAVQRGICSWIIPDNNDSVDELFSALEKWAVQTYEGRKVTFGFVIDPSDKTPSPLPRNGWLDFLANDYSAVFTDCIHSLIKLNQNCEFVEFLSLTKNGTIPEYKLSPLLPIRFAHCIDTHITTSPGSIGVFLLNNGDIILSKRGPEGGEIKLVKRNLHWLNFSYEAFHSAIQQCYSCYDETIDPLLKEVYATMLDVSFAHTGGIIAIVSDDLKEHGSGECILNEYDDLTASPQGAIDTDSRKMKNLKRQIVMSLVDNRPFIDIDRKLRSELTAMDGACILTPKGQIIAFGAIIRNKSGSAGGGRSAACEALSDHGMAIKISTDGYVELYIDRKVVYEVK